jgi:hypothetical protein
MSMLPTPTGMAYMCATCGGFLARCDLPEGVVRDVYCRSCKARKTIYLGGRRPPGVLAEGMTTIVVGEVDPPPIEERPVRPRKGRG